MNAEEIDRGAFRRSAEALPLPTVGEALRWARRWISGTEARLLLAYAARQRVSVLIAFPERALPAQVWGVFRELVERRAMGEPIAYLVGEREFYGRRFWVDRSVLIPRPETETLVDLALAIADQRAGEPLRILELGVGSGCVAITLALELPSAQVVGVDVSKEALQTAFRNARRWGVNISLLESDWFSALEGETFDLIVANPPYIASGDPHLNKGDVTFEPRVALVGGEDGLAALRQVIAEAPPHLEPGGWLLVEHGWEQGRAVRGFLLDAGFLSVQSWQDLSATERVSGGQKRAG
ncbi:MAG: peptide chain release factor N(5)-glutamine methyltransferase [Hydrogenophilus sp.]|nr:peptide chain release factor N(5)-glutamine methyltransferase [Hydrogenophilus sp.]